MGNVYHRYIDDECKDLINKIFQFRLKDKNIS